MEGKFSQMSMQELAREANKFDISCVNKTKKELVSKLNQEKKRREEQKFEKVKFHLTGFGKFAGVLKNPTTILMNKITHYVLSNPLDKGAIIESVNIIKTCGKAVRETLQELHDKYNEPENSTVHIWLHLGVYTSAPTFHLESRGINEANFSVPDEGNWQPRKQKIIEANELTHQYNTTIPIDILIQKLKKKKFKPAISDDAGRFICNYTYYKSLHMVHETQQQPKSTCPRAHSLFVHVPSFGTISEEIQLNFVHELINQISSLYLI